VNKLESQLGRLYQTVRAQHDQAIDDHKRINTLESTISDQEAAVASTRSRTLRDLSALEVFFLNLERKVEGKIMITNQDLENIQSRITANEQRIADHRHSADWDIQALVARIEQSHRIAAGSMIPGCQCPTAENHSGECFGPACDCHGRYRSLSAPKVAS
tara:strand:- start:227 stop:706 length:480 start_codon:yes stop_codon:yes gene_type:complete